MYQVSVSYENLDIEDLDQMESIAEALPDANFISSNGCVSVLAALTADSAIDAVEKLVVTMRAADEATEPVRADLSLVAISDIAEMVGLNREAVRLWTVGKRGPGNFPTPLSAVGDRVKVWAASDVHRWLTESSVPCPEARPLSIEEIVDANRAIERLRRRWAKQPTLSAATKWTTARHEEVTVPVLPGGRSAAGF